MSPKSERLAKQIQEIRQLVLSRVEQNEQFSSIAQALEEIGKSLQTGQLTLQIVCQNSALAQALHDYLYRCKGLAALYEFKIAVLPDQSQEILSKPFAKIILRQACGRHQLYEVPTAQTLVIGRHPESSILISDSCLLVSGYHAEVQSVAAPSLSPSLGESHPKWQICDFSKNGTYVNGQQVQGSQVLQAGDRISLGAPTSSPESAELIFECSSDVDSAQSQFERLFLGCDVLCLLTDSGQVLTANEKQFILEASKAQITKKILLVETPGFESESLQPVATALTEARDWLQEQGHEQSFDLVSLSLPSFLSELTKAPFSSCLELDEFCKSLEGLVKRRPEQILVKRVARQVLAHLTSIERLLDVQKKELEREQQGGTDASGVQKEQLREKLDIALKQINADKSLFFRQAREVLKQSKVDLLDEYLENSISCKIRRFADRLKPCVTKRNRRKYLHLEFLVPSVIEQSESEHKRKLEIEGQVLDANTALMRFCRSRLSFWSNQEWQRLCTTYVQGGLVGLFQRTYNTLSSIPSLDLNHLDPSLFQPSHNIDDPSIFQEAIAVPACGNRYQEVSPVSYIFKTIRGQWMQFIFMFSLFSILGIAGRRQIMQHLTAPIISAFKSSPWISALLLSVVLFFLFRFLSQLYQEYRDAEREKEAEKLRNNLRNYYQALTKNRLAEKLVYSINEALDAEEQKIEAIMQIMKRSVEQGFAEGTEQISARVRSDQYRALKKDLKNDKDKLQKFKRMLEPSMASNAGE
ncbi:FHA domain-containing protein [Leptolyngbya sp. FACHB-261]|uniref:FHA domain-containing protein n=1 Tax=Leptolyngbya sp. FACHB-261 TaxID=2692806 RepID=UPI00168300FB|nr:FHA domain-containing protein [Leptolyngbya sp. FACHB-261]MBD2103977.1 FHA domain-containing protein [Leptolyngbya sp. FACHB-261]